MRQALLHGPFAACQEMAQLFSPEMCVLGQQLRWGTERVLLIIELMGNLGCSKILLRRAWVESGRSRLPCVLQDVGMCEKPLLEIYLRKKEKYHVGNLYSSSPTSHFLKGMKIWMRSGMKPAW